MRPGRDTAGGTDSPCEDRHVTRSSPDAAAGRGACRRIQPLPLLLAAALTLALAACGDGQKAAPGPGGAAPPPPEVGVVTVALQNTPLVTEQLNDITVLPDGRVRVVWSSDEDGFDQRNVKAATFTLPPADNTAPVLGALTDVVVTLPLNSTATSTTVTFPTPTATDDSGSPTVTTNPISGSVFQVGVTTVNVTATDPTGNTATGSFTVNVLHNFSGFLQPVENMPTLNIANAGQAVPVKFSLSGNKGLNIFAAGYPASGQVACDATEPGSVIEETVSAGGSSLIYDATADRYTYVWKTQKAWKGTCRILSLRLTDGSDNFAKFRFK